MKKGVSVYVSQQMMQILSFMNYLALMIKIKRHDIREVYVSKE